MNSEYSILDRFDTISDGQDFAASFRRNAQPGEQILVLSQKDPILQQMAQAAEQRFQTLFSEIEKCAKHGSIGAIKFLKGLEGSKGRQSQDPVSFTSQEDLLDKYWKWLEPEKYPDYQPKQQFPRLEALERVRKAVADGEEPNPRDISLLESRRSSGRSSGGRARSWFT